VGKLIIRLVTNATGKREVDIAYESDSDALPMEHEEEHRRLVEKVVGSLKSPAIVVERARESEPAAEEPAQEAQAEREKLKQ
jgi:hypothetical protein